MSQSNNSLSAEKNSQLIKIRQAFNDGYLALPGLSKIRNQIERIAKKNVAVLLLGESGTGKTSIASHIHKHSQRVTKQFVSFNVARLTPELAASALFGHVKGAFTGADEKRRGLIRKADNGTLLIDEIGDLSPQVQAQLLRVLDERVVRPVGTEEELPVNFRLICATNRDLIEDIKSKKFREDLYWRIAEVVIRMPSLNEHPEDIPQIAKLLLPKVSFFAQNEDLIVNGEMHPLLQISQEASEFLQNQPLTGNIRQLRHLLLQAALNLDNEENVIDRRHLEFSAEIKIDNRVNTKTTQRLEEYSVLKHLEQIIKSLVPKLRANQLIKYKVIEKKIAEHKGQGWQTEASQELEIKKQNITNLKKHTNNNLARLILLNEAKARLKMIIDETSHI